MCTSFLINTDKNIVLKNLFTSFSDMSPVLAGFIGAGVLVVAVVALIFVWTCCQKRYHRMSHKLHGVQTECGDPLTDPPYKFIHMLKGMSIYPEALTSSKRIVRLVRRVAGDSSDVEREGKGCPVVLVDVAAEKSPTGTPQFEVGGLDESAHLTPRLERELPVRADYCCLENHSSSGSQSSSTTASNSATPFTDEADRGTLSLTIDYNFPKKALVVTVLEARGLRAVDSQAGSADPYIKMTILPEKKHRVKTRVLRKTLEPAFDETFTFYGVPYSSLSELTLHFLVLSFDHFARDDVIGEALVPLTGVELSTGKVQITQPICKRSMQVRAVHYANITSDFIKNIIFTGQHWNNLTI